MFSDGVTLLTLEGVEEGVSALTETSDDNLEVTALLEQVLFVDGLEDGTGELEASFVLPSLGLSEPQVAGGLGDADPLRQCEEVEHLLVERHLWMQLGVVLVTLHAGQREEGVVLVETGMEHVFEHLHVAGNLLFLRDVEQGRV